MPSEQPEIFRPYYRRWKAIALLPPTPRGFCEWCWAIWGWDIFFGPVPFLKTIVAANVVVWWWMNRRG